MPDEREIDLNSDELEGRRKGIAGDIRSSLNQLYWALSCEERESEREKEEEQEDSVAGEFLRRSKPLSNKTRFYCSRNWTIQKSKGESDR